MTLHTPLWLQNSGGYTGEDDRRLIGSIATPGVRTVAALKVTQRAAGANRSVDVAPGVAVVDDYLCVSDAVVNVPLDAAPGVGETRWDAIIAQVRDSAVSGADDDFVIDKITGTAAASNPVKPSVPARALLLGYVWVLSGASTITNAVISDARVLSGDPSGGLAAAPSIPPSFDGQVVGGGGQGYVGSSGTWSPLRPTIDTARFASNRPSNGSTNSTVTFAIWGQASISPAPTWPVIVEAELTGHFSAGGFTCAVEVSLDNGTTWLSSPERLGVSTGGLDFVPVSLAVATSGTPTGNVLARGRFKSTSGATIAASNGYLKLTAIPGT